jgi:hypothetical protein
VVAAWVHGVGELGEVVDADDLAKLALGFIYRLCYPRGPEGIIVELAQQIG